MTLGDDLTGMLRKEDQIRRGQVVAARILEQQQVGSNQYGKSVSGMIYLADADGTPVTVFSPYTVVHRAGEHLPVAIVGDDPRFESLAGLFVGLLPEMVVPDLRPTEGSKNRQFAFTSGSLQVPFFGGYSRNQFVGEDFENAPDEGGVYQGVVMSFGTGDRSRAYFGRVHTNLSRQHNPTKLQGDNMHEVAGFLENGFDFMWRDRVSFK